MMEFPDEEWCVRAVDAFNQDPEAAAVAQGWSGDFGIVVERAAGDVGIYLGAPAGGGVLPRPQLLSRAALEARGTSYYARASEVDWRALIDGQLDPIAAIVQRRLEAKGDLAQVAARLAYRGLAERWLERLRRGF